MRGLVNKMILMFSMMLGPGNYLATDKTISGSFQRNLAEKCHKARLVAIQVIPVQIIIYIPCN